MVFLPQLKILSEVANAPILIAALKFDGDEREKALNSGADFYGEYREKPEQNVDSVIAIVNSIDRRARKEMPALSKLWDENPNDPKIQWTKATYYSKENLQEIFNCLAEMNLDGITPPRHQRYPYIVNVPFSSSYGILSLSSTATNSAVSSSTSSAISRPRYFP